MNKKIDEFDLNEMRELLKNVKHREIRFKNELELLECELNGDDIKKLAKISANPTETSKLTSLVRSRIQESQSLVKAQKTSQISGKKSSGVIKSSLTEPKKKTTNCQRCQSVNKNFQRPEAPQKRDNEIQTRKLPKLPPPVPSLRSPNFLKDRPVSPVCKQTSFEHLTKSKESSAGDSSVVLVLGVVRTRQRRVETESKGTNTSEVLTHSNAQVQTLPERNNVVNAHHVAIQANVEPNFKLVEIKPPKRCIIQVLPSINIRPPPAVNNRNIKVIHNEQQNLLEAQPQELQIDLSEKNAEGCHQKLKNIVKFSEEVLKDEIIEERPATAEDSTCISNFESEIFASNVSLSEFQPMSEEPDVILSSSLEDRSSTAASNIPEECAVRPVSPCENYSAPEITLKETAAQTSQALATSSVTETSSCSSWPDMSQISVGEIIPVKNCFVRPPSDDSLTMTY